MPIYHIDSINNSGMEVVRETSDEEEAVAIAVEYSSTFGYSTITTPGKQGKSLREFDDGMERKHY